VPGFSKGGCFPGGLAGDDEDVIHPCAFLVKMRLFMTLELYRKAVGYA
jgi:hypothetical protein